jgi:DNA-binding MarR family transcriptional regulator
MKSCQDGDLLENDTKLIDNAIMDWTAVFVRLWMHDISNFTHSTGLSFGQVNLMLHLHYRGPCEISGVSEVMQMTAPGASQMVERMVQQGLVGRSEVPGDRRVRMVYLTDQGKDVVRDCIRLHESWVHNLAESLSAEDQSETSRILRQLTVNANKLASTGDPRAHTG